MATAPRQPQPWSPRRRYLVFGGVAALAAGAATFAVGFVHFLVHLPETVADCYTVWTAADVVIQHLEWSHGAWPRSWEDLEKPFEVAGRFGDFENLRRRVEIDFPTTR